MAKLHTLYPYEEEGVKFLSSRKTAYLGDDMGLGKTVQAIRSIHAVVKRILTAGVSSRPPMPTVADFGVIIIAPAHLLSQWKQQIDEQMPQGANAWMRFRVLSYQMAVKYWKSIIDEDFGGRPADFLIFDEAHYLKSIDSQRSQALLGKDGVVHYAKRVWMLSGTPITNRPIEVWHILKTLAPWCLGTKYQDKIEFAKRFCNAKWDGRAWDMKGHSNEEELGAMLKSWMLRRTKAEVLPFLPPVIEEVISIPFDQAMFEEIMFESHIIAQEQRKEGEEAKIPDIGSLPTLRRLIGMSKRDTLTEHIKNILDSGKTVCAYGYHPDLMRYIKYHIGQPASMIVGGMSVGERGFQKQIFVNGRTRLFLGQMEAAGEGLDGLQAVCDFLVFLEPDWLPKTHKQVVGRLHRIGQKGTSVTVQYLVAQGTVEENILRSQINKQNVIERIIE